jgi:hypothetical protein
MAWNGNTCGGLTLCPQHCRPKHTKPTIIKKISYGYVVVKIRNLLRSIFLIWYLKEFRDFAVTRSLGSEFQAGMIRFEKKNLIVLVRQIGKEILSE